MTSGPGPRVALNVGSWPKNVRGSVFSAVAKLERPLPHRNGTPSRTGPARPTIRAIPARALRLVTCHRADNVNPCTSAFHSSGLWSNDRDHNETTDANAGGSDPARRSITSRCSFDHRQGKLICTGRGFPDPPRDQPWCTCGKPCTIVGRAWPGPAVSLK